MPDRLALNQLEIRSPCVKEWDQMQPAGQTRRFCDHCQKHVHDLSLMTASEAERLFCESAGREVCVRMERDRAGRVMTLDYAPVEKDSRRAQFWPTALIVSLVAVIASLIAPSPIRTLGRAAPRGGVFVPPNFPTAAASNTSPPSTQPATTARNCLMADE